MAVVVTVPVLKIEIAFASAALDTAPTWVDVTSFVRRADPVAIKRGRDSELVEFATGTASFTLSNRDRRFDPTYSSGPYFGQLTPGRQVRITCTHSATTYDLFRGFILGWPQRFGANGRDAVVYVECIDALGWMAKARTPGDLITEKHTSYGSLTGFLRGTDQYLWLDDAGSNDATLLIGTRSSAASILDGSNAPSLRFNNTTAWQIPSMWTPAGAWTMSFGVQVSTNKDERSDIMASFGSSSYLSGSSSGIPGSGTNTFYVAIDTDGRLVMDRAFFSGVTTTATATTDIVVGDNQPHWIVLTGDGVDVNAIYVDGIRRNCTFEATAAGAPYTYFSIQPRFLSIGSWTFTGNVQDVAWHDGIALNDAQVAELWSLYGGYLEESASSRLTRVLDDSGWPAAWRDIASTLKATVGKFVYRRRPVIDLAREVEQTEQGRLFAAADGKVTLLQRYHVFEETRGATSQATFADDGADIGYSSLAFQYNDIDIINDVTVKAPPYGDGHAVDVTSANELGSLSRTVNTVLPSSYDAAAMAAWLVGVGVNPVLRADPMTIKPERNPTMWPTVLGLKLGDRVTFQVTPMRVGSQMSQDMTLEHIEWQIVEGDWTFTPGASPIPVSLFIIGSSLVGGTDIVGY